MLRKIVKWICKHQPRQCQACGKWQLEKDLRYRQLTTGAFILICETCDDAFFRPYSKGRKKNETGSPK